MKETSKNEKVKVLLLEQEIIVNARKLGIDMLMNLIGMIWLDGEKATTNLIPYSFRRRYRH